MSRSPISAVLDVLGAIDEIEWARCVGGDDPLRPPFVAWRFKNPRQDVEAMIAEAVVAYSGPTEWTINKGERNWVIEPAKFRQFARNFRLDTEASQRFGIEFPAETQAALYDAAEFAAYLRRALLPH